MAGGLTLIPSYTTDQTFPAYQDRLLIKSLGVQTGVVGKNDFKVTAGTGLQVEVEKGKSFVEQTGAKQESSNTFYNGMYNILSPTKQNPYNSAEIPTTAPQIAQIILRVYDVEELGTTGSSFGRIEWLNGIPNTLASKTVIEEGKASIFGAVTLPTSSFRCAYVVVPKNAITSSEYIIIDSREFCTSSFIVNTHVASSMAHYGELFVSENTITATLPEASTNKSIAFFNFAPPSEILKIKCQSGNGIYGDFISNKSEVELLPNQHLLLMSINSSSWSIIAGEPKREQVYSEKVERLTNTVYEPSATRETYVVLWAEKSEIVEMGVWVGAKATEESEKIASPNSIPGAGKTGRVSIGFPLPAGQKWRVGTSGTIYSSYLFR